MDIVAMMTVSELHLNREAKKWLDEENCNTLKFFSKSIYGWFVAVPKDSKSVQGLNHIPESLRLVIEFAARQGCSWIMLDTEGPIIPELRIYDFEE